MLRRSWVLAVLVVSVACTAPKRTTRVVGETVVLTQPPPPYTPYPEPSLWPTALPTEEGTATSVPSATPSPTPGGEWYRVKLASWGIAWAYGPLIATEADPAMLPTVAEILLTSTRPPVTNAPRSTNTPVATNTPRPPVADVRIVGVYKERKRG